MYASALTFITALFDSSVIPTESKSTGVLEPDGGAIAKRTYLTALSKDFWVGGTCQSVLLIYTLFSS